MTVNSYTKIKLNVLTGYLYFFVYAFINFLISPFLVSYLGPYHFGIWKSVNRIFDLASFSDGRSSQALKWVIANKLETSSDREKSQIIGGAIKIWLFFLPLMVLVISLLYYFLPILIKDIRIDDNQLIQGMGVILGVNILLKPLLEMPDAVLIGSNNSYVSKSIQIFWLVTSNIIMAYLVFIGYGIIQLASVLTVTTFINGACVLFITRRKFSWLSPVKPNKKQINDFFSYSKWILMWSFVEKLLLSTEILVLGFFLGAIAVANYTFTSFIAQFGLSVSLIFGSSITPYIGKLLSKQDNRASELILMFRESIMFITIIIASCMLIFNKSFVSLWVGTSYYLGDMINLLIVISFIQITWIRSESQVHDLGLLIKQRVIWGVLSSILSFLLAYLFFELSNGSMEYIFLGIIIGRLIMNLLIPRIVTKDLNVCPINIKKYGLAFLILVSSFYLGSIILLEDWFSFVLTCVIFISSISIISFYLFLSSRNKNMFKELIINSKLKKTVN